MYCSACVLLLFLGGKPPRWSGRRAAGEQLLCPPTLSSSLSDARGAALLPPRGHRGLSCGREEEEASTACTDQEITLKRRCGTGPPPRSLPFSPPTQTQTDSDASGSRVCSALPLLLHIPEIAQPFFAKQSTRSEIARPGYGSLKEVPQFLEAMMLACCLRRESDALLMLSLSGQRATDSGAPRR